MEEMEIISTYTRAQAIEDGILVDVSEIAKAAGFKFPVAITASVFEILTPKTDEFPLQAQTFDGRLWNMLSMLRLAIYKSNGGRIVDFVVLFLEGKEFARKTHFLRCVCGPGDNMDPVLTIQLPGED